MGDDSGRRDLQWFASLSDSQVAEFFSERAEVHLVGFPPNSVVCIDSRSYSSGLSVIRGIKSSPSLHLITLKTASPGAPLGIFFRVNRRHRLSVHYDDTEVSLRLGDLSVVQNTNAEQMTVKFAERGVAALSKFAEEQWTGLTCYINRSCLRSAGMSEGHVVAGSALPGDTEQQPIFSPLQRLKPKHGMSGAELTAYHLDRTAYIMSLLENRYSGSFESMLGEFQLAFICFGLIGSMHGLEHWARILRELCNCSTVSTVLPQFFSSVSQILQLQFTLVETEAMEMAQEADLRRCLEYFVNNGWEDAEVKSLAKSLNKQLNWSLCGDSGDGDDSDGPVIVSMPDA